MSIESMLGKMDLDELQQLKALLDKAELYREDLARYSVQTLYGTVLDELSIRKKKEK